MYIVNAQGLAKDLAAGRVSDREKAYYLPAGWVLYTAIGCSTLVFANQGRTWLALFELFMIIVIAVLGIQRCYEVSGGDSNKQFVVDFTCLLVPLTVKVYFVVWGLYWLFAWGYQSLVGMGATYASEEAARLVTFFSRHAGWFVTLIAVLATQAVLFWRMRVRMANIAEMRETSNPSMQPTGREARDGRAAQRTFSVPIKDALQQIETDQPGADRRRFAEV
jgi:hypothetical protein